MLADLVQKNQVIIQELQDKIRETQLDCEEKLNQSETNYKVQLEYLESENRVLKELQDKKMTSEKDRVNFHKTLRNLLLEEIERIEKHMAEKEQNLAQWREHVIFEMQQEKNQMTEKYQQLEESNNELKRKLKVQEDAASQNRDELKARIDYLTNHKLALEQKVDETTKQINSLQGSLVVKRQQSTTDETKWESEKDELYKSLNCVSEILEEKEKLHSQQLKSIEDGYKTSMEVLDKRIKMLNEEKRQLEKQLGTEKGDMLGTLDECNQQINSLRDANTYLVSLFDQREKQAAEEIERMREEVGSLQMFFDSREVGYVQESRKYADNVKKLHSLLERAHERMEEGWDPMKSVSEALRTQVDTLQSQLDHKDVQLEEMRNELIKAQNTQRREITETITQFREYLIQMEEQEVETESRYKAFLDERIENDNKCSERELDDVNKINDALSEINDLRYRIRELEATNKQKEYDEAKSRLVKTEAELTHAKQNLVNYIQSLNTLESKLKDKLEAGGVPVDENDEILRLKMENIRLNEENSSLLNAKQFTEADLNNRIEDLTKKLFIKTEECEELQAKYSNLLSSLNGQREEEIKSWLRRQDLIKRTIEELRLHLDQTRDRRENSLAMKDQEHKLTMDEVKLLRIEANKLQKFWDNQFNEWVKEKRTYQSEIKSLRNTIDTVEEFYSEATDLRKEENELLAEQRHFLRDKEEYYIKLANEKIEIESETKQQRERENLSKREDTSKIIEMLRNEVHEAHNEIKRLKDSNHRRVQELEDAYEKKLQLIHEKEGTSEYHNQKLKNKIEEVENNYKQLHNTEHLEKIVLRNQVKTLSKLTTEKIEKTLIEKENIKSKLDQLASSASMIEDEENRYKTTVQMKLSKIQEFMKKVHQVLASTYKSEELEMILRDLDQIAEQTGLEVGGYSKPISKLKNKITYEDRISAKLHKTTTEINKIKSLEDERQFKNLIEKLSIVELAKRLQDLMKDIEECTIYEKKVLTGEIMQWKEAMGDKEKRLSNEIKALKRERDDILVKLNTLNLNDQKDQKKLSKILDDYKKEKEDQINDLSKENQKLQSYASKVTQLLDDQTSKTPVRLLEKGRYKALQSANKTQKAGKMQYLNTATSNRNELNINDSVRKSQTGGRMKKVSVKAK
jgi:hypothetical protein